MGQQATPVPTERKDAVTRRASAGPFYTSPGNIYDPNWDLQRIVTDGYERVVFVHRIVNARAVNGARLPVVIRNGVEEDAPLVTDHPLLALLNKRANQYETGRAFRHRLLSQLQLSKRGVFVEVTVDRKGDPSALHLLNPLWTWARPDPDRFVKDFEVRLPSGELFHVDPFEEGKGGVLWIKYPHPIDPYLSSTWIEAAGLSIDLDHYARLYNRTFMQNDGRPGGLIAITGDMDPADAQTLQGRLSGGPASAGRVSVIEADHAEWIDVSTTPRDAQYVESRALSKAEILIAGGTPLSVLGDASGRTFDNADAEFENFWQVTMIPDLELLAAEYDRLVGQGWDDDVRVTHDTSSVAVLQRNQRAREAQMQAEYDKGLISIDEYRDGTGKDPVDVAASRALWMTAGRTPVAEKDDFDEIQTLYGGGGAPPPEAPPGEAPTDPAAEVPADGGEMPPDPFTDYTDAELATEAKAHPKAPGSEDPDPAELADARERAAALLARHAEALHSAIAAVYAQQEAVVVNRLHSAKARKHTRHWTGGRPGEVKALDAAYVLDRERWAARLIEVVVEVLRGALAASINDVANRFGVEADESVVYGPDALAVIEDTARAIAEEFDERSGRLADIITEREKAGDSLPEIARAVTSAYTKADTWAEAHARNIVGAMNGGSLIGAAHAGAVEKRWLATNDNRTRPSHRAAEGQVVPLAEPFAVGTGPAAMMYPGDRRGPVEEWIACRCTMLFALPARNTDLYDLTLDTDLADLDAYEGKSHPRPQGESRVYADLARRMSLDLLSRNGTKGLPRIGTPSLPGGGWWGAAGFREDLVIRDSEGRFTDRLGGVDLDVALPGTVADDPRVAAIGARWIGSTEASKYARVDDMRSAFRVLNGDADVWPLYDENLRDVDRDGSTFAATRDAMILLAETPPSTETLWRGLSTDTEFAVGDEFEETLASWTPDTGLARAFAEGEFYTGKRGKPVILTVHSMPSLPIARGVEFAGDDEEGLRVLREADERLASGRFRVTRVTKAQPGSDGITIVDVEWVALPYDIDKVRETEYRTDGGLTRKGEPVKEATSPRESPRKTEGLPDGWAVGGNGGTWFAWHDVDGTWVVAYPMDTRQQWFPTEQDARDFILATPRTGFHQDALQWRVEPDPAADLILAVKPGATPIDARSVGHRIRYEGPQALPGVAGRGGQARSKDPIVIDGILHGYRMQPKRRHTSGKGSSGNTVTLDVRQPGSSGVRNVVVRREDLDKFGVDLGPEESLVNGFEDYSESDEMLPPHIQALLTPPRTEWFGTDDHAGTDYEERLGRCYELSGLAAVMGDVPEGTMLVHGTIQGPWPGAPLIGHGWLELPDGTSWEPISGERTSTRLFNAQYRATVEHRYTPQEAREKMIETGHYGQWDGTAGVTDDTWVKNRDRWKPVLSQYDGEEITVRWKDDDGEHEATGEVEWYEDDNTFSLGGDDYYTVSMGDVVSATDADGDPIEPVGDSSLEAADVLSTPDFPKKMPLAKSRDGKRPIWPGTPVMARYWYDAKGKPRDRDAIGTVIGYERGGLIVSWPGDGGIEVIRPNRLHALVDEPGIEPLPGYTTDGYRLAVGDLVTSPGDRATGWVQQVDPDGTVTFRSGNFGTSYTRDANSLSHTSGQDRPHPATKRGSDVPVTDLKVGDKVIVLSPTGTWDEDVKRYEARVTSAVDNGDGTVTFHFMASGLDYSATLPREPFDGDPMLVRRTFRAVQAAEAPSDDVDTLVARARESLGGEAFLIGRRVEHYTEHPEYVIALAALERAKATNPDDWDTPGLGDRIREDRIRIQQEHLAEVEATLLTMFTGPGQTRVVDDLDEQDPSVPGDKTRTQMLAVLDVGHALAARADRRYQEILDEVAPEDPTDYMGILGDAYHALEAEKTAVMKRAFREATGYDFDRADWPKEFERTDLGTLSTQEINAAIDERARLNTLRENYLDAYFFSGTPSETGGVVPVDTPEIEAARERVDAAKAANDAAKAARNARKRAADTARAQSYRDVIAEVRPVGGELDLVGFGNVTLTDRGVFGPTELRPGMLVLLPSSTDSRQDVAEVTSVDIDDAGDATVNWRRLADEETLRLLALAETGSTDVDSDQSLTALAYPRDLGGVVKQVSRYELKPGDVVLWDDGTFHSIDELGNGGTYTAHGQSSIEFPATPFIRYDGNGNATVLVGDLPLPGEQNPLDPALAEPVQWAASFLPTDWLGMMQAPYKVGRADRGHFSDRERAIMLSADSTPPPDGVPLRGRVATHELQHAAEYAVPGIKPLEFAFLAERTTKRTGGRLRRTKDGYATRVGPNRLQMVNDLKFGKSTTSRMLARAGWGYGTDEWTRSDQFPEHYSGKVYDNYGMVPDEDNPPREGIKSNYELLSTIGESVFAGSAYADPEMVAFLLGLYATL